MPLNRATAYGSPAFWIRAVYKAGFRDRSIRAVVRPGDRTSPSEVTHIPEGMDFAVRFIKKPGSQMGGTPPELYPDDGTTCRRHKPAIVKTIGDLLPEDLEGTAPDTATPELVRYHLATIYDTELPGLDKVVTIWRFEHRPDATEE